jgi:hypothetical protein
MHAPATVVGTHWRWEIWLGPDAGSVDAEGGLDDPLVRATLAQPESAEYSSCCGIIRAAGDLCAPAKIYCRLWERATLVWGQSTEPMWMMTDGACGQPFHADERCCAPKSIRNRELSAFARVFWEIRCTQWDWLFQAIGI